MPNVHLFGDVRLGVIDHRAASVHDRDPKTRISQPLRRLCNDRLVGQYQVEKPRAGYLAACNHAIRRATGCYRRSDIAWRTSESAGECEHPIGLVVGMLGPMNLQV